MGRVPDRECQVLEGADAIVCSVCVATYKRPELLEKLLRSLDRQYLPNRVTMEVIVVDNDPDRSGAPILSNFRNTRRRSFSYYVQPHKNISLTRNMAVAQASGQYILFIDDDETASPRWLYFLLKTLLEYGADAVFGPVVPEFNQTTPQWMRRPEFFYYSIAETGIYAENRWTGNCIVRAAVLKASETPFSPDYGVTGGEDTHLFDRLEQQGARFISCREALVSEYLPPGRTRVSYLFMRGMRGGEAHTRRCIEFAGKKHVRERLFMASKAIAHGTASVALTVLTLPSPSWRTRWLMKVGANIGRFLAAFGLHYQWYR